MLSLKMSIQTETDRNKWRQTETNRERQTETVRDSQRH